MMKRTILFSILLIVMCASFAQEGAKFQIGPVFQVSSLSYFLKDDFGTSEFKGAINFQGGISGLYQLNSRISLGSEVSYGQANFRQAFDFSALSLLDKNDPFLFSIKAITRKQQALNLGLHVNLALHTGKNYSLLLGSGVSSMMLVQQDIVEETITYEEITLVNSDQPYFYKNFLTGLVLRAENRFSVGPGLTLNFSPFASFYFNKVHNNANIKARPVNIGINTVLLIDIAESNLTGS